MTSFIDTAWLLTGPFVLYLVATPERRLFAPQNRYAQLGLASILLASVAIAISHKAKFGLTGLDVPIAETVRLALLGFVWARGFCLLATRRKQQEDVGL